MPQFLPRGADSFISSSGSEIRGATWQTFQSSDTGDVALCGSLLAVAHIFRCDVPIAFTDRALYLHRTTTRELVTPFRPSAVYVCQSLIDANMRSSLITSLHRLKSKLDLPGLDSLREYQRDEANALAPNNHGLLFRACDSLSRTWDLGVTAFGGPAVLFQIVHHRFVDGARGQVPWIDEQTYQELFAVCQALPGPSSTKMILIMVMLHAGFVPAVCAFLVWSLPGAIGMYLLSLGVAQIGEELPGPVYGLLSGLNAATVGIIALAAVQLASKAITDRLTRILVVGGACAGICYSALWYFPVIMVVGGLAAVIWDVWLSRMIGKLSAKFARRREHPSEQQVTEEMPTPETIALEETPRQPAAAHRRTHAPTSEDPHPQQQSPASSTNRSQQLPSEPSKSHKISPKLGIAIIVGFFASFAAILASRGIISPPPLVLDLFANMYLAGTIIFGGGPVVIPLLREYVVQPGWVSPRDFLIGLAIIQAFPGPNFNFAVYLSALAVQPTRFPTAFGGFLGFVGIYAPGLILALGTYGIWHVLRAKAVVISMLRGINAAAVGLIFTAVYRLWEQGYLTPTESSGSSLAMEPWWVVVATVTYTGSAWFGVPPAVAIVAGGVLGLLWYATVGHSLI